MSSYCPDWIFNLSSGMIATEFIAKNTTLPALSHKYVDAISKEYENITDQLVKKKVLDQLDKEYKLDLPKRMVEEEKKTVEHTFISEKMQEKNEKEINGEQMKRKM